MALFATFPVITGPSQIAGRIENSDGTSVIDVFDNTSGDTALKIESLYITSTDTSERVISFYLYKGTTSYLIGSIAVPASAGTDGAIARVNALTTLGTAGADDVPCLWLSIGSKLQVKAVVTLTADKVVDIVGRGYYYN